MAVEQGTISEARIDQIANSRERRIGNKMMKWGFLGGVIGGTALMVGSVLMWPVSIATALGMAIAGDVAIGLGLPVGAVGMFHRLKK